MIGWGITRLILLNFFILKNASVSASFSGCAGYVSIPKAVTVDSDQLKVQLFLEGSGKPTAETEVAPKSGFFHVSHDRHGPIQVFFSFPLRPSSFLLDSFGSS